MKSKITPLYIPMLLTLACQSNHENKDGLRNSIPKNNNTSIEQIVIPDTGNRDTSLYSNIQHQIAYKASNLKNDDNFNKYLNLKSQTTLRRR